MRNYANLSDFEFEQLVGDLLGAELGLRLERFARGADRGIDLRHRTRAQFTVVQCKHYLRSSWSDLKRAARAERAHIARMRGLTQYWFATSYPLTEGRKSELATILATAESNVLGIEDIDSRLNGNERVERQHTKLWLSSGTALRALQNAAVHARSRRLTTEIENTLPLWVETPIFHTARTRVSDDRVLIITGLPGVGKTVLARMLAAWAIAGGAEAIEISADAEEAWASYDEHSQQVFLYDDFLGVTTLDELTKNEDSRLASFISVVARSRNAYFVLTTREYIMRRATQMFESFQRHGIPAMRILLDVTEYDQLDKGRILYNHLWHSPVLSRDVLRGLGASKKYRDIVDHPNFSPRIIEFITGFQVAAAVSDVDCGERPSRNSFRARSNSRSSRSQASRTLFF